MTPNARYHRYSWPITSTNHSNLALRFGCKEGHIWPSFANLPHWHINSIFHSLYTSWDLLESSKPYFEVCFYKGPYMALTLFYSWTHVPSSNQYYLAHLSTTICPNPNLRLGSWGPYGPLSKKDQSSLYFPNLGFFFFCVIVPNKPMLHWL